MIWIVEGEFKKELKLPTSALELYVLGLGNPLMGDDGIGVVIARKLRNHKISGTKVFEAGTPGYGLTDTLMSKRRVVFIDAVDSGSAPGSVFWVDPDSIMSDWNRQSLHQVGLADVMSLMMVQEKDPWVRIIGIQPQRIAAGSNISDALNQQLPDMTKKIVSMIKSVV